MKTTSQAGANLEVSILFTSALDKWFQLFYAYKTSLLWNGYGSKEKF